MRTFALTAVVVVVHCLLGCSSDEGKPSTGTDGTTNTPVTGGGAKKKNAETGCNDDSECESGVCFIGGSGGGGGSQTFCSIPCTKENQATVCVAPFTGLCNGKGNCKRD